MTAISLIEYPYTEQAHKVFAHVAEQPWSILLDSGRPQADGGRYDILLAWPRAEVVSRDGVTRVCQAGEPFTSSESPLDVLETLLQGRDEPCPDDIPFCGGAVGYFAYDLLRRLQPDCLPPVPDGEALTPDMAVGIYECAVLFDHERRRCVLAGRVDDPAYHNWQEVLGQPLQCEESTASFACRGGVQAALSFDEYKAALQRIFSYLQEGDCYQVNFAQSFRAEVQGSGWAVYRRLRTLSPAPFAGYMNLGDHQLISSSPERFLHLAQGKVTTSPIKGTRPRGRSGEEDERLRRELQSSSKDRAENLMIVDLLRNDLGRCCMPGSVAVDRLFAVESYQNVHHLVSTVRGRLAPQYSALQLLAHCFPGGSITGAPKYRAMQIIDELESGPRSVYCGSLAYIGFDGNMDSNILIRTMLLKNGEVHFWAGGGIVMDSRIEEEWQECMDKASAMMAVLKPEEGQGRS